jgi:ATP:ADP antiporter, AAA family
VVVRSTQLAERQAQRGGSARQTARPQTARHWTVDYGRARLVAATKSRAARLFGIAAQVQPSELRALGVAFVCHFVLLASYYILRPLRDTMATVFGVAQLQYLFTVTFVVTLLCAPLYSALASRLKLSRLLPGIFWFWLFNILLFYGLFKLDPRNRVVAAAYFTWFSVANLFIISVFWSLMADLFSSEQATRLFGVIAAGGSIGAILGPVITRLFAHLVGVSGLLLIAGAGFLLVIALIHILMREKERLRASSGQAQQSTLNQPLAGNPFEGFSKLLKSPYLRNQAGYMLLMTWIATIAYFLQTDLIAKSFVDIEHRTQAIADIDLVVNLCSAAVASLGLGRLLQRFGVTAGLLVNPLIMILAFLGVVLWPSLLMVQALQVLRRFSQYAVARPSREICFTVVDQKSRYKAKNVIDTVVYRFGDVSAAWVQAGLRAAGFGLIGAVALGLLASAAWSAVALSLGRRYEHLRHTQSA